MHINARALQYTPSTQPTGLQEHFLFNMVLPNLKAGLALPTYFTQFFAQHLRNQFYFRQALHLAYVYCSTITHNRHTITNRVKFVQTMTNENHRDAISLQLTNNREERLNFSLIERRGGFIHDNEL